MIKTTELTPRQRELLAGFRCDPLLGRATFGGPQVPSLALVKKVFGAFGAKWCRGKVGSPGHFSFATEGDFQRFQAAMQQGQYVDPRENDFFPTPAWLADQMVVRAQLRPGDRILEPSAGRGSIITAIRQAERALPPGGGPFTIHACELLQHNRDFLVNQMGVTLVGVDFLFYGNGRQGVTPYDAIVMNPPFLRDGGVSHVLHALTLLWAGGVLVSCMSAGVLTYRDKRSAMFRARVRGLGGDFEPNPDGTFESSGTSVRTVTLTIPRRN